MDFIYRHKTIIFLILFGLLALFLAFIFYHFIFGSPIASVGPTPGRNQGGQLPGADDGSGNVINPEDPSSLPTTTPSLIPGKEIDPIASGGLTQTETLVTNPSSNITSSSDGKGLQYYDEYDGIFYTIDKDGNKVALSDRVFYSVREVAWSNDKKRAVIEYPDGANIVYDFEKEKSITLPKHWQEFEFSSDDKQIVAKSIGLDPENRWLMTANADGSGAERIEPLGNNADSVYPSWSPNNQSIAMFTEGIDLDRQNLYFVGKNQENFKSTIIEGRGFRSIWNEDGKQLLYSVYSNANDLMPGLWVVSAQGESIGQGRRSLGVNTWADKCVFSSSDNVYCAVPQNLEEGAGLFPELGKNTDDFLYKINISTGAKKIIAVPEEESTITNIVVSEDEKTLYFSDGKTKNVHRINL
jgi:hypothetical protein